MVASPRIWQFAREGRICPARASTLLAVHSDSAPTRPMATPYTRGHSRPPPIGSFIPSEKRFGLFLRSVQPVFVGTRKCEKVSLPEHRHLGVATLQPPLIHMRQPGQTEGLPDDPHMQHTFQ